MFTFKEIDKDFYCYNFPAEKEGSLGSNIFMITNGHECILIDSAHREQFEIVQKDIYEKGYSIKYLIVTHYHPDHTGGIELVETVIGSAIAWETLRIFYDDYQHLMPDIQINEMTTLKFGNHKLVLENNPGHSLCTVLITLDDKYVFVGDDIMTDDIGHLALPFVAETLTDHINGVKKIKQLADGKILIPSHGVILRSPEAINRSISSVLSYLNYVINDNTKSYLDFVKDRGIEFVNSRWHKSNTERDVE